MLTLFLNNRSEVDSIGSSDTDLLRYDRPASKFDDAFYLLMGKNGSIEIRNPTAAESEFLDGIYRKYSQ